MDTKNCQNKFKKYGKIPNPTKNTLTPITRDQKSPNTDNQFRATSDPFT
jgi:hypothetical protein